MFFPFEIYRLSCTGNFDISACMQREAEPTQHNHSATTTALTITGDRAEKLQEGIAAQTRHSAVITKCSTDSVTLKDRNLLTELKSIYVVLKAAITSYLLFLYELVKIFISQMTQCLRYFV